MSISVISNFPSGGGNNLKPKILSSRYKETEINTPLYWYSVAHGNGLFIAVGPEYVDSDQKTTNKYLYSYDGENWIEGILPDTGYWYCVCFIKDRFYIVNTIPYIYTSKDGIHWTEYTANKIGSETVSAVKKIVYGNGIFVAIGASNASKGYIAYSYNATKEWFVIPISISEQLLNDVVYGNGMFISTTQKTNQYLYSYDGKRWYEGTLDIESTYINRCYVAYGNGKFIINVQVTTNISIETQKNVCFVSEDGLTWKKVELYSATYGNNNTPLRFNYINYLNGMFFTTSNAWYYTYSYDGEKWKTSECYYGVSRTNTVFGNGKFVNFRNSNGATNMNKVYTLDVSVPPEDAVYLGNASNNDKLLDGYSTSIINGYGINGNIERIKPQLSKWLSIQFMTGYDISTSNIGHITYGNGIYVIIGDLGNGSTESGTNHYWYSYDGISWTNATLPSSATVWSIAYGNGIFVATGNMGKTYYSQDIITWVESNTDYTGIQYVYYLNDTFIITTTDSNTGFYYAELVGNTIVEWKQNTSAYGTYAVYGNGKYIIKKSHTQFYITTNFSSTWGIITIADISASTPGSEIVYGNNSFISIYNNGSFIYSKDGENWNIGTFPVNANISLAYGGGMFVAIKNDENSNLSFWYSYNGLEWETSVIDGNITFGTINYVNDMFLIHHANLGEYNYATISKVPQTETFLGNATENDILEGASATSINGYNIIGKAKIIKPEIISSVDLYPKIEEQLIRNPDTINFIYDSSLNKSFFYSKALEKTYIFTKGRLANDFVLEKTTSEFIAVDGNGEGLFIAVRYDNYIYKSTDGITFSRITNQPNLSGIIKSVKWLNDRFVIIAENRFLYSTDGETWAESNQTGLTTSGGDWVDITYAHIIQDYAYVDCYVAIFYSESAGYIAYSTNNCATWTQKTVNMTHLKSIAYSYGNGKFSVLSGNESTEFLESADAISWTKTSFNTSGSIHFSCNNITYINSSHANRFYAVGSSNGEQCCIYGGNNYWYKKSLPNTSEECIGFKYYNQIDNVFLLYKNSRFLYSTTSTFLDMVNTRWNEISLNGIDDIKTNIICASYGNGILVALTKDAKICTTTDFGETWTTSIFPEEVSISSYITYNTFTYGNGTFCMITSEAGKCYYSKDGITFHKIKNQEIQGSHIYYFNGMFFVFNTSNASYFYSMDGKTFQKGTLPNFGSNIMMNYGHGKYVIIRASATAAAYSEDGINWTDITSNLPTLTNSYNEIYNLAYGNGRFVAVLKKNYILYSDDGETWKEHYTLTLTTSDQCYFSNGLFFNKLHFSYDGLTWEKIDSLYSYPGNFPGYARGQNFMILTKYTLFQKINFAVPPSNAKFLGDVKPEDIPFHETFTSRYGCGLLGMKIPELPKGITLSFATVWYNTRITTAANFTPNLCQVNDNIFVQSYGNVSSSQGPYYVSINNIGTLNYWKMYSYFSSNIWVNTLWVNNAYYSPMNNGSYVAYATSLTATATTPTTSYNVTGARTVTDSATNGSIVVVTTNNQNIPMAYSSNRTSFIALKGITYLDNNTPPFRIAYGNGVFIAVFSNGNAGKVLRSTNGTSWTEITIPNNICGISQLKFSNTNGYFYIITLSYKHATAKPAILRSTDGLVWERFDHPFVPSNTTMHEFAIEETEDAVIVTHANYGSSGIQDIYYSSNLQDWKTSFDFTGLNSAFSAYKYFIYQMQYVPSQKRLVCVAREYNSSNVLQNTVIMLNLRILKS